MRLPYFIARRYFFSRHSATAVNILAGISISGLVVGTAALLVILAAFNGLEDLVKGFYSTFDPDMKVSARIGKSFPHDEEKIEELLQWEDVVSVSPVLEERVLLRYREQEYIASLKGVDSTFTNTTNISESVYRGAYKTQHPDAVFGIGVAWHLGLSSTGRSEAIQIYVPKATSRNLLQPERAFNQDVVFAAGLFAVQPDFDVRYVISDLHRLQMMSDQEGIISSLEIRLTDDARHKRVQKKLIEFFGEDFEVKNRNEQQAAFFKVMRAEGLITYLIFSLILLISSFTLLGSLSMMILDKKQDIHTLWFIGMNTKNIRRVFLMEGLLITTIGALSGLAIGGIIVMLQHQFGLVGMGAGYIVDAYPVRLNMTDIAKVILTVLVIGSLISFVAARRLKINTFN
ncbi:MAG: FtsX-like permease family protein [Cryomorphaceae bacterium]|nr:FtsX-like permease family protein [Cryomorphaceae bacterium]